MNILSRQIFKEYSELLLKFSVNSCGNYFPVNPCTLSLRDLQSPVLWEINRSAKIIRILKAYPERIIQQIDIRTGINKPQYSAHIEYAKVFRPNNRTKLTIDENSVSNLTMKNKICH
jgi:hypothetical protein